MKWLLVVFLCSPLYGEIQRVELFFTPGLCNASCGSLLVERLERAPGVASAEVDPGTGRAYLKWKPNAPFSFPDIHAASRFVGIRISDIHLRVRGYTTLEGRDTITLLSSGDNTSFTLLNPVIPLPNQAAVVHNAVSRQLTPENAEVLLKLQDQPITIQGYLFQPFRSPPYQLMVEQVIF